MNYRYVLKELRHHHHRTLVNVLGIAIGIALFVSINAVSTAYQKAVSLPFKNLGADIVVQKPEKRAVDSAQTPASMRGIRLPFSNQLLSAGGSPEAELSRGRRLHGLFPAPLGVRPGRFPDHHGRRSLPAEPWARQGEGMAQGRAVSRTRKGKSSWKSTMPSSITPGSAAP